jgi:phosphate transport system permease protein
MPTFLREARLKRQTVFDLLFRNLTRLAAFTVLALLAAILGSLIVGSMPSIHAFGFGFLTSSEWNPVTDEYGALIPIVGTLVTSGIALLIAIPVSFGIAIFLTELSPRWLRRPLGIAVELLAGIPSIIYGMWGLFIFAPLFADHVEPWLNDHIGAMPFIGPFFSGPPMGIGMLTAGIISYIIPLSLMMGDVSLPPLRIAYHATTGMSWCRPTPRSAVGGIGLKAWRDQCGVTRHRYAHELRNLLMGNSISSALANEFAEAVGELYTSSLIELGLILFFITFVVLSLARLMLYRLAKREGHGV